MILFIFGLIVIVVGAAISKSTSAFSGLKRYTSIAGILFMVFGFFSATVKQIDGGTIGVKQLFGAYQADVLTEGLHVVNPLIEVKRVDVRTLNYTMTGIQEEGNKEVDDAIRVQSKDQLEISVDLTLLFSVIPENAPHLLRSVGEDFQEKIVRPISRAKIREAATSYNAVDLITVKRQEFENDIRGSVDSEFRKRGLRLENLLVRNINLPTAVKQSIENKITAEQESQKMQFVLQKERLEAERKVVEAKGIADAQKELNAGLSDKLLQYEQIKVQRELVNSPNAKIILLGGGKNPPFILDAR